jgi:hypothetical protein
LTLSGSCWTFTCMTKCSTRARERIIQVNVQQEPERQSYK